MKTMEKIVKAVMAGIMWTVAVLFILFFVGIGFLSVMSGI